MKRLLITLLILACCGSLAAEDRVLVGVRPCGGDNIGTLQDNYCLGIDGVIGPDGQDITGAKMTTPADLFTYMLARLNGVVAPAAHSHAVATQTADGFLAASDKLRVDSFAVAVKGEGALGSGTWTSLATAGYTVESAQLKWPNLTTNGAIGSTHLIQTGSDLSSYGVDWSAIQHSINKSGGDGTVLNKGSYIIERSLSLGSSSGLFALSKGAASITPHSTWTGSKNLITVAANSSDAAVSRLVLNGDSTFNGIYVNQGTVRTVIDHNGAYSLGKFVFVDKGSNNIEVKHNDTHDVAQEVWLGASTDAHYQPYVENNRFIHGYRQGHSYSITFEDGAITNYPVIRNNHVEYNSLVRRYSPSSTGDAIFTVVSGNRVIGNMEDASRPLIYWVGKSLYHTDMTDNLLWNQTNQVVLGGMMSVDMTGTSGADSNIHTTCVVKLVSSVGNIVISGGSVATPDIGIATVCADYSLGGTGTLLGAGNPSYVQLAGNFVGIKSELNSAYITVDDIKFLGNTNKSVSTTEGITLEPDIGSLVFRGNVASTIILTKAVRVLPGKPIVITNAASLVSITVAGNSENVMNLAGNLVASITLAPGASAEFVMDGTRWRQIR